MKIGVKFCGGCNPRYDRGSTFRKLKEEITDVKWITGEEGIICDYWLLICGCQRGCIDPKNFVAKKETLKLESPMDFERIKRQIKDAVKEEEKPKIKILHRNEQASIRKQITSLDIKEFAKITLDYNKMHTDPIFCEKTSFGKPVAHGMLSLSLLSSVMGMKLPGDGTVLIGCNSRFIKPVFVGDELNATVTLKQWEDFGEYYIARFHGVVKNQDGETVTKMSADQMLSKQFFSIEQEK